MKICKFSIQPLPLIFCFMRHVADIFGKFWENQSYNLHNHTVYSDGAHTPEELVQEAKSKLITVLSVTDHDTIGAYTKWNILQIAQNEWIQIIPWFEATVKWLKIHGYAPHLLMYFDKKHIQNPTFLSDLTDTIGQARTKAKLEKQLWNLKTHFWLNISLKDFEDQIIDENFSNITSRNIKQVIKTHYPYIEREDIASMLHYSSPAFIDIGTDIDTLMYLRFKYDMVTVLAHPILKNSQNPSDQMLEYVKNLNSKWYLDGLEMHHPDITDSMREVLKKIDVILHTAGSDTHNKVWSRPMYNTGISEVLNPNFEVMNKKKEVAVMVGRLNPPHMWHIRVIKKALSENASVILFLGSANVVNDKNPFSYQERSMFLNELFQEKIASGKMIISYLNDVGNNELWTQNLWNKVRELISGFSGTLNFYWGDFAEDRAITAIRDNEVKLGIEKVLYTQVHREHFTLPSWEDISATNLRNALASGDFELARKFMLPQIADLVIKTWKDKQQSI